MAEFFDLNAELGSDDDDQDFNDDGEPQGSKRKNRENQFEDSSEEEDDDDDEEAAAEVRKGFIVDEDDEEEDEETRRARKRERKKRRREEREEEEGLDDEDLDLIGALDTEKTQQSKFKRLKQGHRDRERGIDEIFDDDDEDDRVGRGRDDEEMDDFIEEDELDDDERRRQQEELEVSRKPRKALLGLSGAEAQALDPAAWEDFQTAFGGEQNEYDWALDMQNNAEMDDMPDANLETIFEPSQLAEKMLLDDDVAIKVADVPERYQVLRKSLPANSMTQEEIAAQIPEESEWIASNMWLRKRGALTEDLREPFKQAIAKVLEFTNVNNLEVPFIFQHRKDYLIHAVRTNPDASPGAKPQISAAKLLNQGDLWEIIDFDMKFKAMLEKRKAIRASYDGLRELAGIHDDIIETLLEQSRSIEDVGDLQDYLHFRYSAELTDLKNLKSDTSKVQKRSRGDAALFESVRASQAYNVVRGFGVSADDFAQSLIDENHGGFTDDPAEKPEELAEKNTTDRYKNGAEVLKLAKLVFAEELVTSPRLRKYLREQYFRRGRFDCIRTEKGLRKLDEEHPLYEIKYLRNMTIGTVLRRPELFLKMLKAQTEGLIDLRLRMDGQESLIKDMRRTLESDNYSEMADAWNNIRRDVLDSALSKIQNVMMKSVTEFLRAECENQLARTCREEFSKRLDQAPFKPPGVLLGSSPRVLTLTNGRGSPNKDDIYWAYVEDDGRVLEHGRLKDLRLGVPEKALPDGQGVKSLVEIVNRRKPDVIGVSGFSVETRVLYKDLQEVARQYELKTTEYEDEDDNEVADPIEVIMVNDEVARLYYQTDRAAKEHPTLSPLIRYCIALGHYVQSPLKEYASLNKDITSIQFHPDQNLLPTVKLAKSLETAMVDIVNLVGVNINEAVSKPYTGNLLQYVCGLGPRKAQAMLSTINKNGGTVSSREELLLGDPDSNKAPVISASIFENCASFIFIEYEQTEATANYLDNTRIHPEDYDLARKMAADALELDEEDIRTEEEDYGKYAVVRKLVRDEVQDKVNDLILEEYAEQLELQFFSRKRATLETIRAELQQPYEELRHEPLPMATDEVFTMLTGETKDSLAENMVVPLIIKKIFPDHIEGRLDCGIEAGVGSENYPTGVGPQAMNPRDVYHPQQVVQAKLTYLNRKQLTAQLSLREDAIKRTYRREFDRDPDEWDDVQEEQDRIEAEKRTAQVTGRAQRVIKHPLFRSANSVQAEEYLAGQSRGDCIIRPSSKGNDHLAITWKVSEGIFQHIDVLEMNKENEFSVGRTLKIGGKYTYSDLDELIELHIKAMARKVDEIMNDERYQSGSREQTEQWLAAYTQANPTRSMYAFCIDRKFPGYFVLCFKAGHNAKPAAWPIKIIPNAFQLMNNPYPDMKALKNGFKTVYAHKMAHKAQGGAGGPPAVAAHMGAPMNGRGPVPVRRY